MKRTTMAGMAVVLGVLLASPAVAQSRVELQMAAELRMLQEQQQLLSLSVAQLAESIKALAGRMDEGDRQVMQALQTSLANLTQTLKNVGNDISAIRERTQDADTRLRTLADEIEALRKTLLSLPSMLTQVQPSAVDPSNPNAAPPAAPGPVTLPPAAGLSPARMLAQAKGDYFAGQFSLAIKGFEALIEQFPGTEAAAEAQYMIGESQAAEGRHQAAVAAYTAVIERYPKSAVVPEAYYKRGLAYERLGQPEAARTSWEELIKLYPDSAAVILARQGLDRLRRARP
jgi:tol-pal system protein YbgF